MPTREPTFVELISEWIPIWEAAGLPYIPVEEIGRAPAREWLMGIEEEWSPAVSVAMEEAAASPEDTVVRWDHGSGDYLKHFMEHGDGLFGRRTTVPTTLDDIRFFELTMAFAARHGMDAELIMWRRPWMGDVFVVDGFPLEFRAYVYDGRVQGVSSYYPQRPLPQTDGWLAAAVWKFTEELIEHAPLDFTCDWMVRDFEGTPVFTIIECGPPHVIDLPWADPCCFVAGKIEGVALEPRPGSYAEARLIYQSGGEDGLESAFEEEPEGEHHD